MVLSRPKTIFPVVLYIARPATDLAYECVFEGERQGLLQVWKLSLLFTSLRGLTHDVLFNWNRLRSCWVKNNPNFPQSLTVTVSVTYAFLWQGKWYRVTSLTKHWFMLDTLVCFLSANPPSPHTLKHTELLLFPLPNHPLLVGRLDNSLVPLLPCCNTTIRQMAVKRDSLSVA